MDEKSENSETIHEKEPLTTEKEPITTEKEPTIPKKDEEPRPQPKARGRPKGTKDTKPRIKRVPIHQEEEEPPPPQVKKVKRVEVQQKPVAATKQEEPPSEEEESEEEAPLPQPKSPRTLHRERMQQTATERWQLTRDRHDRFERILDNFMGF